MNDAWKVIGGVGACLGLIVLYIALGASMAWCIEWAWNVLIPAVFHGPSINYVEACALYILASFVLGILKPSTNSEKS